MTIANDSIRLRFTPGHKHNFEVVRGRQIHALIDEPEALGVPIEASEIAILNPWQWCMVEKEETNGIN